jgi:hypothetical protein
MFGCEHQREAAAHAEPDDAGPAGAVFFVRQAMRAQIAERLRPIADKREEARPPAAPVEQIRRQSEESFRRKPVRLAVQVMRYAESIVGDDHARPWFDARRRTKVAAISPRAVRMPYVHLLASVARSARAP